MNIVTPYPTNIPINTVNVATESARRDNQLRDMITKPNATESGAAERGVASENDKSKPSQAPSAGAELNSREAAQHQKINERGQGSQKDDGQQGQDQQSQGQSDGQSKQQQLAETKKRLSEVESKLEQLDLKQVRELKSRDTEVRAHENAHAAIGGQYAGSPTYSFKRGPDGRNYAVGGEVKIDTSPIAGDAQATVAKMQQVRAAALAPAEPSGQDRKVAASASQSITKALAEQTKQKAQEQEAKQAEQAEKAETAQASQAAESETETVEQASSTNQSENGQAQGAQGAQAVDPFTTQFAPGDVASAAQNASQTGQQQARQNSQSESVASVFGDSEQINVNRAAAEQRNNQQADEVVARASRIQNFYAGATKPRESGFSSFAWCQFSNSIKSTSLKPIPIQINPFQFK